MGPVPGQQIIQETIFVDVPVPGQQVIQETIFVPVPGQQDVQETIFETIFVPAPQQSVSIPVSGQIPVPVEGNVNIQFAGFTQFPSASPSSFDMVRVPPTFFGGRALDAPSSNLRHRKE